MFKFFTTKKGFSLIEISIAVTVASVIGASLLSVDSSRLNNKKISDTLKKIEVIEDALLAYYNLHGRLPCPASGATVGTGGSSGDILIDTVAGTDHNYCDTVESNEDLEGTYELYKYSKGVIPIKELSLPEDMMFDSWGRKMTYMVENDLIDSVTFNNLGDTSIEIYTDYTSTTPAVPNAGIVLMSHGKSGHGAWLKSGTRLNTVTNNPRRDLFNGDSMSVIGGGTSHGDYIPRILLMSKNYYDINDKENSVYDDIIRYKTLPQIKQNKKDTFYSVASRCDQSMFFTPYAITLNTNNEMHINNSITFEKLTKADDIEKAIKVDIGSNFNDFQSRLFLRKVYCRTQTKDGKAMSICFYNKDCVCNLAESDISTAGSTTISSGYFDCSLVNYWAGDNNNVKYVDTLSSTITLGDATVPSLGNLLCFDQENNC